ncbi:DUF3043 domain-containing protein [Sanguibacter sp. YZGR15]|uniref:DUF3043 domain-containing protein n=1 Tax=Sanguibacter suaedae TaxID=2795737 RepID=A0A934MAI4_9MICO|nr:DUF3043 domain-containing protein [Sanguibacter suaedae]MBI9114266.1 DUF3043 domain-containing protein [Sanguibacter suaedae]
MTPSTTGDDLAPVERAAGKGHPTPKRKEAQAANKRPLVPDDRRAAAKAARAKARAEREREYQAMQTGDEKNLPYRDRGPVRRYVRNYVDARWNVGEFFLFLALGFLVVTLFAGQAPVLALVALVALYVVVLVAIVDAFVLWRLLKKRLVAKFGEDALGRGLAMYAVMRAFQIRRARLPKPQVKHGEYPV